MSVSSIKVAKRQGFAPFNGTRTFWLLDFVHFTTSCSPYVTIQDLFSYRYHICEVCIHSKCYIPSLGEHLSVPRHWRLQLRLCVLLAWRILGRVVMSVWAGKIEKCEGHGEQGMDCKRNALNQIREIRQHFVYVTSAKL
jgi:hypothetical protein